MNDTDKIMEFVAEYFVAAAYGATDKLRAAIEQLVSENASLREQNTELAADLAGVARPGAEPVAAPYIKMTEEVDLVLSDPDTKLSAGAVRALQWLRTWISVPLYTTPQTSHPLFADLIAQHAGLQEEMLAEQASQPEARLDALNTLCKMMHSGEEVEGDEGLAMLVPMDLWNEAQEALELLSVEDDNTEASQPAHTVPAFTSVAQRKLNSLLADGYQITGYSIERTRDDIVRRGAVTSGGMLLWWHGDSQPAQASQPLTNQQIEEIITNHNYRIHGDRPRYIARATEAAHGIGAAQDADTQAVLIEGVAYIVPMPVAVEMLRLCIKAAQDAADAERDVLAERERQKSAEGWTPEHDDDHDEGELACAAAGYAMAVSDHLQAVKHEFDGPEEPTVNDLVIQPPLNPWPHGWVFKPAPARRMLVKAGALIIAEIERLDRAAIAAQKVGV